jgi:DNA-binding IclR family transcriptional regulator
MRAAGGGTAGAAVKRGQESDQATGTQLLDRTVAVIKHLGEVGEQGARMAEIAESLGLKGSTAHRIVSALERHGLIERERATRRYRLALALFALGATAADGTGLRKLSRTALLRLAAETEDTVFLMARSGFNVVCVDRQEGSYVLDSLTGHVGGQIPMGVGPASQAILAFLPADEAATIINANAPLYGRYNGLTPDSVRAQLPEIRARRFALDHGALVQGISALAVPILPQGRDAIAAIAINMTSARLEPERLTRLVDLLTGEVAAIEQMINPLEGSGGRVRLTG